MANTVTLTKIVDGPRNVIVHVSLTADGQGELNNRILIDPDDLLPQAGHKPQLIIEKLWWTFTNFSGTLSFDYMLSNQIIWQLNAQGAGMIDFTPFGGIKDRSDANEGTGKVCLLTNGFIDDGRDGTLIIQARKF